MNFRKVEETCIPMVFCNCILNDQSTPQIIKITFINILNSWLLAIRATISFFGWGGQVTCNLFNGARRCRGSLCLSPLSPGDLRWKLKLLRSGGSGTFS